MFNPKIGKIRFGSRNRISIQKSSQNQVLFPKSSFDFKIEFRPQIRVSTSKSSPNPVLTTKSSFDHKIEFLPQNWVQIKFDSKSSFDLEREFRPQNRVSTPKLRFDHSPECLDGFRYTLLLLTDVRVRKRKVNRFFLEKCA